MKKKLQNVIILYYFQFFDNQKYKNFNDLKFYLTQNRLRKNNFTYSKKTKDSLYSNTHFSNLRELSNNSIKSKSMKKLIELQNEFEIEIHNKIKKIKPFSSHKTNLNYINTFTNKKNLFENYSKYSINKNKLIRNSSMNSFKKNSSLNQLIFITDNKNKYIKRNNSKIWRNINKVKETIEGNYNSNGNSLFNNYLKRNNSFLKKKSNLNNNIIFHNNNHLHNKNEKKNVFYYDLELDENNMNKNNLKTFLTKLNKNNIEKNISTINSYTNSNSSIKKSDVNIDTDDDYKIIVNNLNKL